MLFTFTLSWPLPTLVFEVCYQHTAPFQHITPPLFSHYRSLLELLKAPVILVLTLSPIHPFRSVPLPFFTNAFIGAVPHHLTNFNPWELELNSLDFRANASEACHCTVPNIAQQDCHNFPSYFHILNTGNDTIYSTPWYFSFSSSASCSFILPP